MYHSSMIFAELQLIDITEAWLVPTSMPARMRLQLLHPRTGDALSKWMQRYADLIATKRGLAPALPSEDPAFENLRAHVEKRVRSALTKPLESAVAAGEICSDVIDNASLVQLKLEKRVNLVDSRGRAMLKSE